MSVIVFAGAAQFAAVGYVASGLAWPGIILLTALLNARHLLYSAALRPWLRDVPLPRRAVMAHLLTDEAFALVDQPLPADRSDRRARLLDRRRSARRSSRGTSATLAGVVLGAQIPDPARLGIDVIFPAAMIGLAVGLITGRRELVAAIVGAGVAVGRRAGHEPVDRDRQRRDRRTAGRAARPETVRRRAAPLGTPASAERYRCRAHAQPTATDADGPDR